MRSFPPTSILNTRSRMKCGRDATRLPFHSVPNDRSRNERDDVREAEARVYD